MLEESGIVASRREDAVHATAIVDVVHHLAQHLAVVPVVGHLIVTEHLRAGLAGHRACNHRIGSTRGYAQVVLQYQPLSVLGLHQVDSRYMGIHPGHGSNTLAFGHIALAFIGKLLGDHSIGYDMLLVIDVIEKGIECLHALHKPLLQHRPFIGRDAPGNGIEGKELFVENSVLVNTKAHSIALHPLVHRIS